MDIQELANARALYEKAEKLEKENKELAKLFFNRCRLHLYNTNEESNINDMFQNGKCEGYSKGINDDEPCGMCRECIIHVYYE